MDLLIWGGPVFAPGSSPYPKGDVGKVAWENPTEILTISGDGSSYFAGLAEEFRDPSSGRVLPGLLKFHGKSASDYDKIAIAGFSAFHGLANQLLRSDGDKISAAVLLDSCFSAAEGYQGKQGYVDFGRQAVAGEKLLVMTASNGRNSPPLPPSSSGSECALTTFNDATGGVYEWFDVPPGLPDIAAFSSDRSDAGARSIRSGDFFLLDYSGTMLHHQHVNEISVEVLQTFLAPYLGEDFAYSSASSPFSARNLGLVAGALGVSLALYFLLRKPKS